MNCSSVNFLPTEVLLTIFQNLPRTEVYKCLYVCRFWNRVATPEYLKKIILTDEMINKWHQNSALNYDNFKEEDISVRYIFPNSNHVLSLKIDEKSCDKTNSKKLVMVLYSMPNVREIDLHQASNNLLYQLLEKLKETITLGKQHNCNPLKNVQRVILPVYRHNFYPQAPNALNDYYFICSQNTRSITHFRLVLNSQKNIINNMLPIEYKFVKDLFESLSNLTHLEIFCIKGPYDIISEALFGKPIFTACLCLRSLAVHSDLHPHINTLTENSLISNQNELPSVLKLIDNRIDNTVFTEKKNQVYNNDLKELSLYIRTENSKDIYSFISLHKQLRVLHLEVKQLTLDTWWYNGDQSEASNNVGSKALLDLLRTIPFVTLSVGNLKPDNDQYLMEPHRHYCNLMNRFLVALSPKAKECDIDINFSGITTRNFPKNSLSAEINKKGRLSLKYSQKHEFAYSATDYKAEEFLSHFFGSDNESLFFTSREQRNALHSISSLKLSGLIHHWTYGVNNDVVTKILKEALIKCPNLSEIKLSSVSKSQYYELTSSTLSYYKNEKNDDIRCITGPPSSSAKLNRLIIYQMNYSLMPLLIEAVSGLQISYLDVRGTEFSNDDGCNNISIDFKQSFPYLEYLALDIIQDYKLRLDRTKDIYYFDQFLQLEYSSTSQPLAEVKPRYYEFIVEKKKPFPNYFKIVDCSEDRVNFAKSTEDYKVTVMKLTDRIKVIDIFSTTHAKGAQISMMKQ